MMRNLLKRHYFMKEQGSILALVVMTLALLSILGLALATVSFANVNLTTVDRDYQSTYYIAEAGANQTYVEIEDMVNSAYESTASQAEFFNELNEKITVLSGQELTNFSSSFGEQPTAEISIQSISEGNPRQYQIVSKGEIGKRERSVTKGFQVNWKSGSGVQFPSNAVAVLKDSVSLNGGATVSGDVYLDSLKQDTVSMSGGTKFKDGKIYVPSKEAANHALNAPNHLKDSVQIVASQYQVPWSDYQQLINAFPLIPSYAFLPNQTIGGQYNRFEVIKNGDLNINSWQADGYNLDLKQHVSFNNINVTSNNSLNIDTNNKTSDIVVNNLNISQGKITLVGSGTVNLYIKNDFSLGGGTKINMDGETSQLNIYLAGTNKSLKLSGNQKINGSLFAQDSNLTLTGGGGFQGYILTGGDQVTFDGGSFSEIFLLAPNAEISASGGANIYGTLIGKKLIGSGGTNVIFQALNIEDFPFGSDNSKQKIITQEPSIELD
ncbi:pilus assembly PilX N-terminal domain-containing protein [Paraliobacillus ryukyuensis]|uniref:pilus assembly PilX N-terminal domain-containing protein n=1 Tax=Paraliobacillus ryukyuensis TaxID=200904 RepID=UPI0015C414C3|nr:pilus assembly PilX N-terminal domain-containing protein [Paraliobacillus ryukyuensis]